MRVKGSPAISVVYGGFGLAEPGGEAKLCHRGERALRNGAQRTGEPRVVCRSGAERAHTYTGVDLYGFSGDPAACRRDVFPAAATLAKMNQRSPPLTNNFPVGYTGRTGQAQQVTDADPRRTRTGTTGSDTPLGDRRTECEAEPALVGPRRGANFRQSFKSLYPDYLPALRQHCPDLTRTDELIAMLLLLGQNNDEIALTLGISRAGINKARSRMRKRLGLVETGVVLEDFLKNIGKGGGGR